MSEDGARTPESDGTGSGMDGAAAHGDHAAHHDHEPGPGGDHGGHDAAPSQGGHASHEDHEGEGEAAPRSSSSHEGHGGAGADGHDAQSHTKGDHAEHSGGRHEGHSAADFRKRFYVSLVLTIPILALAPELQQLLGFPGALTFPGAWATGYNVIAIPLAAGVLYGFGILLPPALAAVFMSASTVIVAFNARLLRLPS